MRPNLVIPFSLLPLALQVDGRADSVPRGVGPEHTHLYSHPTTFTCLDGSRTLPKGHVNDDSCDCPDGSDEPGTAACAHLGAGAEAGAGPRLALPGFYCQNEGHRPQYLPFHLVNDGVCDYDVCCDGSEEFEGVGGLRCANRCDEVGRRWRELERARTSALSSALRVKHALVNEAVSIKKALSDTVSRLAGEIGAGESAVEKLKTEIERLEGLEKVQESKNVALKKTEDLLDRVDEWRKEGEEKADWATKIDQVRAELASIFDPETSHSVLQSLDESEPADAAKDSAKSDPSPPNWDALRQRLMSEISNLGGKAKTCGCSKKSFLSSIVGKVKGLLFGEAQGGTRPWITKRLQDVHDSLRSQERSIKNDRAESERASSELSADYGADDVYIALKSRCPEYSTSEYTYQLCLFDKAVQKSKQGGRDTSIGTFSSWARLPVDAGLASSAGPSLDGVDETRVVLEYTDGQYCWNGPRRRATVYLYCAGEDVVKSVSEDEKCVYRIIAGTPGVCLSPAPGQASSDQSGGVEKDEL